MMSVIRWGIICRDICRHPMGVLHPAYRVGMGMPSLDFEVMSIIYRKPIHDKSAREKN